MIPTGRYIKKTKTEYTFFSSTHGIFSWIDHILGYKTNLNKFKRIEIISSIFSDNSGIKLEIDHRKKNSKKNKITWRINNMLVKKNNGSLMKSE